MKIAASAGISESLVNSLLSMRDQTALKDFKKFSSMNAFFKPLLAFCVGAIEMEGSADRFPHIMDLFDSLLNKHLVEAN